MSSKLDLSLDDLCRVDKGGGGKAASKATTNRASRRTSPYGAPARRVTTGGGGGGGGAGAHSCSVYVGNLAYEVSWQDLKDHCKQAGDVRHADVLLENGTGRSKGCGIVVFGTPRDAQNAIEMLHDTELKGRPIFVREDREAGALQSSSRGGGAAPVSGGWLGPLLV